ncbi:hypothetical protein [Protofrankia sp. BMG5.30]|uniref:hypothetical protein n=1 Tax=Protofrankia sp. BMG5.30 TaxID=1834514 RepID=UPI0011156176|nr:hypothetical protein [Protofrankia sp. BMG5.30]
MSNQLIVDWYNAAASEAAEGCNGTVTQAIKLAIETRDILIRQGKPATILAMLRDAALRARELAKVWGTTVLITDVERLAGSWPPPGSTLPWGDIPAALCLVAGTLLTDRWFRAAPASRTGASAACPTALARSWCWQVLSRGDGEKACMDAGGLCATLSTGPVAGDEPIPPRPDRLSRTESP